MLQYFKKFSAKLYHTDQDEVAHYEQPHLILQTVHEISYFQI